MEECESLDSEMTELQEFQCETSEAASQDDEDEVEELRNRCFTHSSGHTLNNLSWWITLSLFK